MSVCHVSDVTVLSCELVTLVIIWLYDIGYAVRPHQAQ